MELLQPYLDQGPQVIFIAFAIFARVGAAAAFLPGLGDRMIPIRVRLAGAVAATVLVGPMVWPGVDAAPQAPAAFAYVLGAEATAGLFFGFAVRLMIFALQTAGALIAQNMSLSQLFGPGVGAEQEATVGTLLTLAAITLALIGGLHVKLIVALAGTYDIIPFGQFPDPGDVGMSVVRRAADAFGVAISLALPFIIGGFIYNLALGAVNRAMPQLMVAFIGAPLLTGGGLALLLACVPVALRVWLGEFDTVLAGFGGWQ